MDTQKNGQQQITGEDLERLQATPVRIVSHYGTQPDGTFVTQSGLSTRWEDEGHEWIIVEQPGIGTIRLNEQDLMALAGFMGQEVPASSGLAGIATGGVSKRDST